MAAMIYTYLSSEDPVKDGWYGVVDSKVSSIDNSNDNLRVRPSMVK